METAQAFYRQDFSGTDRISCGPECFVLFAYCRTSEGIPQFQVRPASRAGIGLSMETSISGVLVLYLALGTHNKSFHGRVSAIVRECLNDAEPRTAIGAIGKGILISPVHGIEDLTNTFPARRKVGQNQGGFEPSGFACADFKPGIAHRIEP